MSDLVENFPGPIDDDQVTEHQFAAARGLIREAQQEAEREQFKELQQTWLDALRYFRKTEKHIGPPGNPRCSLMYGYLLNSLRSLGQLILSQASSEDSPEIRRIKVALRDLAIADYSNEHLSESDEAQLEQALQNG